MSKIDTSPAALYDLADEIHESGACRYCNRDPYHRVDNGVGMEPVAVVCCEAGVEYYQYGHEPDEPTTSEYRAASTLRALAAEKEAAGDAATLATVRARLLAAEEARDAYIERALRAEAQVSARFSDLRVDYEKLTLLELMERCRSSEEARDAAIARAEKAEAERGELSAKVDRMTEHAKARDKRIRAQRAALRKNWEIVDAHMRARTPKETWKRLAELRLRALKAEAELAARLPCDPADPCAFAQDLASESRTLDGLLDEAKERAKDAEARAERMRTAIIGILPFVPAGFAATARCSASDNKNARLAAALADIRAALDEQESGDA